MRRCARGVLKIQRVGREHHGRYRYRREPL
nr:MAG TPA: hypothetical protein [Caudoviricetes sp.]